MSSTSTTVHLDTPAVEITAVEITPAEPDRTRTFLLLHGGGGVATMAGFAELLAERTGSRVLLPTHPGFGGTPRPEGFDSVAVLARAYVALLDRLDLTGVTVVGNSFGGWLAAEIALLGSPRVSAAVLIDAIGIDVEGHPATDVSRLSPAELAAHAWHDPRRAPTPPPAAGPAPAPADQTGPGRAPAQPAGSSGPRPDLQALAVYAGPTMSDPTLLDRLPHLDLPVHVIWGESDRIVDVSHAKAFAAALPRSRLTVLPASGHLPQLETPEALLQALLHP
ncbi:alpha/beta hydrolase [Paractinoplanes ferrugineus]|uniref:Alpha/beta hydrolase n=1 Tax=Paractinoplanes ferrugineus TaxID=113564 RepID=A0A919JAV4_9ACTN|nr:alpha/beta hydrolase [Actinoplanes ferrugineus]GIE15879.1 alpha/beta hydrolase [Actinoplanes ferrugineus]